MQYLLVVYFTAICNIDLHKIFGSLSQRLHAYRGDNVPFIQIVELTAVTVLKVGAARICQGLHRKRLELIMFS